MLGIVTGILSGMLGVGGGVIVVPALVFILNYKGMPDNLIMHLAVGTSLAVMVFTTLFSLRTHLRHPGQAEFWRIAKVFTPFLIVGVVLGAILADFLHSSVLKVIFGGFIMLVALQMLLSKNVVTDKKASLSKTNMRCASLIMGTLSGMLGVGGGSTVVPYLLYYQVSMRNAVRVSIFVGLLVACVGSIVYSISGINEILPANCIGYVYWPAWLGIGMGSVLFAPLGVKLSYLVSTTMLKRVFAVLMLLMGVRMIFS